MAIFVCRNTGISAWLAFGAVLAASVTLPHQ
jgi:hypothetical protein